MEITCIFIQKFMSTVVMLLILKFPGRIQFRSIQEGIKGKIIEETKKMKAEQVSCVLMDPTHANDGTNT